MSYPIRNAVAGAVSALIVMIAPASAEAVFPADKLVAQGDLLGLCNRFADRIDQNMCQLRVSGTLHGRRAAQPSAIVFAQRSSMPQTRSGVLFNGVSGFSGGRNVLRRSNCTAKSIPLENHFLTRKVCNAE